MVMQQNIDINTEMKELYKQYSWYANSYPPVVQEAIDDFFLPGFQFILLGVSRNINTLMDKDGYFVTKVRIDEFYDMFFRASEQAIGMILEKILGRPNSRFNLNKVSDLEAKIITAFNDYMYSAIKKLMAPPPPTVKRSSYDVMHITFLVKDLDKNEAAKFIITLPAAMVKPDVVVCEEDKFENEYLYDTKLPVRIDAGTSRFKMLEIKNIEAGDIIVLENSSIDHLLLRYKDYEKRMNINPDMNLEIQLITDNEGEDDMGDNDINLWDSIEVDLVAQFDAVKMSLGDLKKIDEGLVVDVSSIFENRVTLKVDDKDIARGELVIVNDRYGVKVIDVLAGKNKTVEEAVAPVQQTAAESAEAPQQEAQQEAAQAAAPQKAAQADGAPADEEDEFDYSDFELEDEDI